MIQFVWRSCLKAYRPYTPTRFRPSVLPSKPASERVVTGLEPPSASMCLRMRDWRGLEMTMPSVLVMNM